jgi:hypothetical protein
MIDLFSWARSTDPQTSKNVSKKLDAKLRWGSQRHLVLKTYAENPLGLIDEEAGEISGLRSNRSCCYWKRCSELRQMGLIEDTGETRKSESGNDQIVSKITFQGKIFLNNLTPNK